MSPGVQTPGLFSKCPSGTKEPGGRLFRQERNPIHERCLQGAVSVSRLGMWDTIMPTVSSENIYSLEHLRFSSFISFGKERVLITSALASQPLRAMPAPRRRKPACSLRCASQLMTHLTPFDFA